VNQRPIVSTSQLVWGIVLTAVAATAIQRVGVLVGKTFHWGQLWSTLAAIVAAVLLVRALAVAEPPIPRFRLPLNAEAPDRPFVDVACWEDRLAWSLDDPDRFALTIQTRLRELVGERLRLRHGVDLATDPARAAPLLDPVLLAFVTNPPTRAPSAHVVDDIVRRIEEI